MLPLFFLYGATFYEETIIALGALAALLAELMAWRHARGEVAREIADLRAEAAALRADYSGAIARVYADLDAHRRETAQALDLDRRLVALEAREQAGSEDEDQ